MGGKCCSSGKRQARGHVRRTNVLQGVAYGLLPHTGCIAFIVGSVLGVTILMESFKPLLMNRWFFHILILISVGFATLSSALYLRRCGFLSMSGARRKWRYLSTMYGSTLGINIVLFLLVFPLLANVSAAQVTGAVTGSGDGGENALISMAVDIPCPGHAPLISSELRAVRGVLGVRFSFPNVFDVAYDSAATSKDEMLSLAVFGEYPATVLEEAAVEGSVEEFADQPVPAGAGGSCCGSAGCGSYGGGCGCGGGW